MKYLLTTFVLLLTTSLFAQDTIDVELFLGCWADSREENTVDVKIFRPCDYQSFPASRFRFRMVLKENNECDWLYLAQNDAHRMKKGTWKFNNDTNELTIVPVGDEKIIVFEVINVNAVKLKLKNNYPNKK